MRRLWFSSLAALGFFSSLAATSTFAGDDAAKHRCEPKPPPVHCGTPDPKPCPDPTPDPMPKPTPVVRDHRHPPVTTSDASGGVIVRDHRDPVVASGSTGPIIRDHRDPVVVTGPIIRDHRDPVITSGPTIRDHRKPRKPKDPVVTSGTYHVPAPVYVPRPTVKTSVDTSGAPGGVVVGGGGPTVRDHRKGTPFPPVHTSPTVGRPKTQPRV